MKKGLWALLAGAGIFLSSNAFSKDIKFNEFVDSFRKCTYSQYNYQYSPTIKGYLNKFLKCFKFNDPLNEKGLKSEKDLENWFKENGSGENGWIYHSGLSNINGKIFKGAYAAKIEKEIERDGVKIYLTDMDNGIQSPGEYLYKIDYAVTSKFSNGKKGIIIETNSMKIRNAKIKNNWKEYEDNHAKLVTKDNSWDPVKEQVYISLNDKKDYYNTALENKISHEIVHAKSQSNSFNNAEEELATYNEISNSPITFTYNWDYASKGDRVRMSVIKCISGTNNFKKESLANFYLEAYKNGGKSFIQKKAEKCIENFK